MSTIGMGVSHGHIPGLQMEGLALSYIQRRVDLVLPEMPGSLILFNQCCKCNT